MNIEKLDKKLNEIQKLIDENESIDFLMKPLEKFQIEITCEFIRNNDKFTFRLDDKRIFNNPGIYMFEIYIDNNDWIDEWKTDGIKCTPGINDKFLNEKYIEGWRCIYVGKHETNLENRIREHIFLEKDKTTYGLKIKERNLKNSPCFRITWFPITEELLKKLKHHKIILLIFEHLLYKHKKPIFGSM